MEKFIELTNSTKIKIRSFVSKKFTPYPSFFETKQKSNFLLNYTKLLPLKTKIKN